MSVHEGRREAGGAKPGAAGDGEPQGAGLVTTAVTRSRSSEGADGPCLAASRQQESDPLPQDRGRGAVGPRIGVPLQSPWERGASQEQGRAQWVVRCLGSFLGKGTGRGVGPCALGLWSGQGSADGVHPGARGFPTWCPAAADSPGGRQQQCWRAGHQAEPLLRTGGCWTIPKRPGFWDSSPGGSTAPHAESGCTERLVFL